MSLLGLMSDLHANREAMEAVLEDAKRHGVESWALLGDFVGYGADPAWVVDRVQALVSEGAVAVKGNHDEAVVQGAVNTMVPQARTVVRWTRDQLKPSQIKFLEQLPLEHLQADRHFVHANAADPKAWGYVQGAAEAQTSLQHTTARVTFCGHVHEPRLFHLGPQGPAGSFLPEPDVAITLTEGRQWLVIGGSCGQPRDGNPAACYATFDSATRQLTYRRVPYDVRSAGRKILAAGLPPFLAERLIMGV